jgi:DNA-binding transcriptional LysR family regulator
MKIELLTTFLEVSRTLHFRIASESLFITQSAVSARIKLLEGELGVLLFDRSQKNLKLTSEGHRLIKHANEIIFMWQKTKQDVGVAFNTSEQLAIGSIMSIWDIILHKWLYKLHCNKHDLGLLTNTNSPIELRRSVLNGVIDLAFLFDTPFVDELITEKVATVPLHLVSTTEHLDIHQQTLSEYVMVDYGASVNAQHLRAFQDTVMARHYMSQPSVALDFILEAGGCAYMPMQLAYKHIQSKRLFLVKNAPVYSRDIFAIYLARSQKKALVEEAIQFFPGVS